jgi:hypothetical protein
MDTCKDYYYNRIKKNGRLMVIVPEEYRTFELYMLAIENKLLLRHVPEQYKTLELCKLAVKINIGRVFDYIPEQHHTLEFWKFAIQNNNDAIYNIPEQFKTLEIYNLAVRSADRYSISEILQNMPIQFRTLEICHTAIKKQFLCNIQNILNYIPEQFKTFEFYNILIQRPQYKDIFNYIPEQFKTIELYKNYVKYNGCLNEIPTEFRTLEICIIAFQNNSSQLEYVPEQYKPLVCIKSNNVLKDFTDNVNEIKEIDFIYVLLGGDEWEDIIILLSKEEAIKESKNYPNGRVEIFSKNNNLGYRPTYNYYKNGELCKN